MTETILPEGWTRPAGFSEGTVATGSRVVSVAGQFGVVDGEVAPDFAAQWTAALRRVRTVVESAGGAVTDIAALNIYLTDFAAYQSSLSDVAAGYREAIGKHFPAITMVEVSGLIDPKAMIEIQATAVLAR